jgi:hypothetical protein
VQPSRIDLIVSGDADDDLLESWSSGQALRLDLLANEATHVKTMAVLDALVRYRDGPALRLVDLLFGNGDHPPPRVPVPLGSTIAGELNEPQKEAIAFALETDDVALIHGPPGALLRGNYLSWRGDDVLSGCLWWSVQERGRPLPWSNSSSRRWPAGFACWCARLRMWRWMASSVRLCMA